MNRRQTRTIVACIVLITSTLSPIAAAVAAENATSVEEDAVRSSIRDGRSHLLNGPFYADDHWQSNISVGTNGYGDEQLTMQYALTLEHLDADPQSKQKAISFLLSRREADGGWNDPVLDFGMLLLLRKAGPDRYEGPIDDIRAEIDEANYSLVGGPAVNVSSRRPFTPKFRLKLYYATMSDRYDTAELFPEGTHKRIPKLLLGTPAFEDGFDPNATVVSNPVTDTSLGVSLWVMALDSENANESDAAKLLSEALLTRRLHDGAWQATPDDVFALMALHEAGYETDAEEIQQPLNVLRERQRDSGRLVFTILSVWETAWAMRALNDTGVSASNETMRRAAEWLMEARVAGEHDVPSDAELARPPVQFRSVGRNGWGYKSDVFSDWDDTSAAVTALRPFGTHLADDDLKYLFGVQREDGSWATYYREYEPLSKSEAERVRKRLGPNQYHVLFEPKIDPAIMGHVLEAAGSYGYTVENNESVRNGVEYLLDNRASNGMWAGVWGERYTYGTSRVLVGMRTAGVNMSRPEVQTAAKALVERQNDDGGWGERSPSRVIVGEQYPEYVSAASTPEQTAWAVQSLLAAGYSPDHPAVQRGVNYLLEHQREDGSWDSNRVFYFSGASSNYNISAATQATVIRALSMYAHEEGIDVAPKSDGDLPLGSVPLAAGGASLVTMAAVATYVRRMDNERVTNEHR